jgi:cytochrome c553
LLEGQGYVNEFAPGCLSCHEAEWDDDEDITPVLSNGAALHTAFFGWFDPREEHQDYVDDEGVSGCISCHGRDGTNDLNWGGKTMANSFFAPGCLTCHENEWNDDDDDDDDDD